MAERIEQYLDEVGAHVRWKRVRPALTQELRTHLEEQAEAYRAEGLPAAEAEAEAVRQMGDAEQIGLALDAVHRPKRQTAILSLAGICILLGAIFRILSQDSPKLFTLAALVLTAGLLLGGYYFDYRRLARYAWQIYGVVLALGAVCLSRSFHLANGSGSSSAYRWASKMSTSCCCSRWLTRWRCMRCAGNGADLCWLCTRACRLSRFCI